MVRASRHEGKPGASRFDFENATRQSDAELQLWTDLPAHPHLVGLRFFRSVGDERAIFSEVVEGGSLTQWIDSGRLYAGGRDPALLRILDLAIQFAWELGYAHQHGLVHQDVKPGNVLMTPEGMVRVTASGWLTPSASPAHQLTAHRSKLPGNH